MDDETVNGVRQIMEEAVNVNNSWLYQAQSKSTILKLSESNPFVEAEGQVVTNVGYVYKVWNLGIKKKICIRSTIHSYIPKDIKDQVEDEDEDEEEEEGDGEGEEKKEKKEENKEKK